MSAFAAAVGALFADPNSGQDAVYIADGGARWGGITLAHNVASAEEVDAVIERAREAGGTITREPSETFYGGYAGVFCDLDGHAWEIAHNPGFGLAADGNIILRAEALEAAREAATGQDVRIGGGATVIRDFLAAGLVDHMHIVVVPILLGRGVRLWDRLESLENDFEVEAVSSPSGVTHLTFSRRM